MKMNKLKRSHDRKVTNLVNNAGNGSLIQNTFGLPAGKNNARQKVLESR